MSDVAGGLGYVSRNGNPLRAGRSQDRIPVRPTLSAATHSGPETHPASCAVGAVTSWG